MSSEADSAGGVVADVDWSVLRGAAKQIAQRSYSPYSHVRVGAAAITDTGEIIVGTNVENASYGLSTCAEVSMISALVSGGGRKIVAVTTSSGDGEYMAPCGRCRQVLYEFGGPELLVDGPFGARTMASFLPDAFGPDDVPRYANR
jgi:cytidine deaminase